MGNIIDVFKLALKKEALVYSFILALIASIFINLEGIVLKIFLIIFLITTCIRLSHFLWMQMVGKIKTILYSNQYSSEYSQYLEDKGNSIRYYSLTFLSFFFLTYPLSQLLISLLSDTNFFIFFLSCLLSIVISFWVTILKVPYWTLYLIFHSKTFNRWEVLSPEQEHRLDLLTNKSLNFIFNKSWGLTVVVFVFSFLCHNIWTKDILRINTNKVEVALNYSQTEVIKRVPANELYILYPKNAIEYFEIIRDKVKEEFLIPPYKLFLYSLINSPWKVGKEFSKFISYYQVENDKSKKN